MDIQITIDDPKAYTRPWGTTVEVTLAAEHRADGVHLPRKRERHTGEMMKTSRRRFLITSSGAVWVVGGFLPQIGCGGGTTERRRRRPGHRTCGSAAGSDRGDASRSRCDANRNREAVGQPRHALRPRRQRRGAATAPTARSSSIRSCSGVDRLKARSTAWATRRSLLDRHALALRSRRQQRELPQAGAVIVAHENTTKRMSEIARPARHALRRRRPRRRCRRRRSTQPQDRGNGEAVELGVHPASAHRHRHLRLLHEGERAAHGRCVLQRHVSVHRRGHGRQHQRDDCGADLALKLADNGDQDRARPWTAGRQGGAHQVSRHARHRARPRAEAEEGRPDARRWSPPSRPPISTRRGARAS